MPKKSAGILVYRFVEKQLQVMLVHPGGPLWAKRDEGVWSIPKGEFTTEEPLDAARREFTEETGLHVEGKFIELTAAKLKSGKIVYAWAIEADLNVDNIESNLFEMEWPPKSGKKASFPEADRAAWFILDDARQKINTGQLPFIEQLEQMNL